MIHDASINKVSVQFIYSEKATKFYEISTVDSSYVVPVKSTMEISQNFVAFSKYLNFTNFLSNSLKKSYKPDDLCHISYLQFTS